MYTYTIHLSYPPLPSPPFLHIHTQGSLWIDLLVSMFCYPLVLVCCSVLQRVAVQCVAVRCFHVLLLTGTRALQCVVVCCSVLRYGVFMFCFPLVLVSCSVLQFVAVWCIHVLLPTGTCVLHCIAVCCSVLQCGVSMFCYPLGLVCSSVVLQWVAACCSALQCVVVCCGTVYPCSATY